MLVFLGIGACQSESEPDSEDVSSAPSVVELSMVDHAYGIADSIPSGWVTFRTENAGNEPHEFVLQRLPEGKTAADLRSGYIQPLDRLRQLLAQGAIDTAEHRRAVRETLPVWTRKLKAVGGGAPLAAGYAVHTTLNLEPGAYAMICRLPSPGGHPHFLQGMARALTVTKEQSEASAPEADVTLRSAGRDISLEGPFRAGKQTLAFRVEEPPEDLGAPYKFAALARLGPDTSADALQNYRGNLHSIEFLGGLMAIPPGKSGYLTVELKPGRYGWSLPHVEEETVVKTFTVE